ncbi:MAG: undecaprenyldiphospho-muramoylpentapeptide beta-N-acetylglucosaminyltransferase [Flaviflexus sp.]|nr:undecaprenyldiphospho-muramoylpentapeptide beta-N-acetylglucosaminyltransferase [Flaviflexus sp.]
MRILAAAGGTAGHVNPMLAAAAELISRGHEVTCLGTKSGLEAELVPAAGHELLFVDKVPVPRRPSIDLLRLPVRLRRAVAQAGEAIDSARADVVLGFGGYVSAPAYLAARRRGVPIVVQEQNARPGLANRLGARFAAGVSLTFPGTKLSTPGVTRLTGLPLRPAIAELAGADDRAERRARAAERFGLDPDLPTVLITGGSSGARHLNQVISRAAATLTERGQVLHLTGKGKTADIDPAAPGERYRVLEYLREMEEAYAVADLVVSRSGAGMVAELAALTIPAVVVPLPIGNGEQELNARPYIDSGGFLLIRDAELDEAAVATRIAPLLEGEELARRSALLAAAGVGDGAAALADLIEEM